MKSLIVILIFAGFTHVTLAQKSKPATDFFNKKFSKGIFMGVGISHLNIKENNWQQTNLKDTFNSVSTKNKLNLFFGMQAKVHMKSFVFYRQKIQLTFESLELNFARKSGTRDQINIQNVLLDFPIHFLFQSNRDKVRPFVFLGVTPKYLLGQNKETENMVTLKKFDMTQDIGIGMEIKSKHFAIAPELTISSGLFDVNKNVNTSYSKTISKLRRQNVNFTVAIK